METESYYEIIAENTRTGNVERRIIHCWSDDPNKNNIRATREFYRLRRAGFNLIRTDFIQTKRMDVEWLNHGNA